MTTDYHIIYCTDEVFVDLSQHEWGSEERDGDLYAVNELGIAIPIDGKVHA